MDCTVDSAAQRWVVIGGGQAAAQAIDVARQKGFAGEIDLVTEEPVIPYQRPPLSKQYLTGAHGPDWLSYRPSRFYERNRVTVHAGRRATEIDRTGKTVRLDDGKCLAYDRAAIMTGTRARRLSVDGSAHPRLFYIRTLADVDGLRIHLPHSRRVVIIGGGFIGLETAAVLSQQGIEVTLLAAAERLLPRVVAGRIASFLLEQHLMHGVQVELKAAVSHIENLQDDRAVVELADGRRYEADLVLVGIGAIPNVELAEAAGIVCSDGIVVDELARTSDPDIVSAGDCTNHPNGLIGRRLRLETVHNAVEQGRTAGATIAGEELPYIQMPWVWSDQYKFRLQSVGLATDYDRTVQRGDPAEGRFSLFYYRGSDLVAVNCINQPAVFGASRRLLNERIPLDPDAAGRTCFDLSKLLSSRASFAFDIPWPTKWDRKEKAVDWGFS